MSVRSSQELTYDTTLVELTILLERAKIVRSKKASAENEISSVIDASQTRKLNLGRSHLKPTDFKDALGLVETESSGKAERRSR